MQPIPPPAGRSARPVLRYGLERLQVDPPSPSGPLQRDVMNCHVFASAALPRPEIRAPLASSLFRRPGPRSGTMAPDAAAAGEERDRPPKPPPEPRPGPGFKCHGAVFRSWLAARLLSVLPERPPSTGSDRLFRHARMRPLRPARTPPSVMPGLVPGIHFRRRNGPDGDARNKSGHDRRRHDVKRHGVKKAGATVGGGDPCVDVMNCHVFVMRPSANVMFLSWAHAAASCFSALFALPLPFAPCLELGRVRQAHEDTLAAIVELVLAAVIAGSPFVASALLRHPGPRSGSIPDSRCRRSRRRTSSNAGACPGPRSGAAARTEAGPRSALARRPGRRWGHALRRRRARALRPASPPVRGEGRLRSCVPPSRQSKGRDGASLFPRVIARVWARGRGRAYRGGAARAPDCARETADALRPSVPAGVFFAAPSHRFLQKSRKAARKRLSLLSFYTMPPNVKPMQEQKMKTPEIFHEMPATGAGAEPFRTARHFRPGFRVFRPDSRLMEAALSGGGPGRHGGREVMETDISSC